MISRLEGELIEKTPTQIVLSVGGIGFGIQTSIVTYEALPKIGEKVVIYTSLQIKNESISLYGFATNLERKLFETLIQVTDVGPKIALGILSSLSALDLCHAILNEDIRTLTNIRGVGSKIAQRLILELKDKIRAITAEYFPEMPVRTEYPKITPIVEDAINALIALGCKPNVAKNAINEAIKILGPNASLEELIKEGLKHRK